MPFALLTTHIWQRKNSMPPSLILVAIQRLLLIDLGLNSFTCPTGGDLSIWSEDLSYSTMLCARICTTKRSGQIPINRAQVEPFDAQCYSEAPTWTIFFFSRTFWFFRSVETKVPGNSKFKKREGSAYFRVLNKVYACQPASSPGAQWASDR